MPNVVSLTQWREQKSAQIATLPALECPKCEDVCPAQSLTEEGATVYRCTNPAHRAFSWRIAEDGSMLSGVKGNRPYYSLR
jgi:formate hydrogenlyase subunit 6/NADH:ubiquinone oxidoreductase subunit I